MQRESRIECVAYYQVWSRPNISFAVVTRVVNYVKSYNISHNTTLYDDLFVIIIEISNLLFLIVVAV